MPDKQKTLGDLRPSVPYGKESDKKPMTVATIAAIVLAAAAALAYNYPSEKPETPAPSPTKVAK